MFPNYITINTPLTLGEKNYLMLRIDQFILLKAQFFVHKIKSKSPENHNLLSKSFVDVQMKRIQNFRTG